MSLNIEKNLLSRRGLLRYLGIGSAVGLLGLNKGYGAPGIAEKNECSGTSSVKIKNIRAIGTAPYGANLVVVKVETTEPGLYGLGCATFTQRAMAVISAINNYMNEFCVGKNVDDIEDLWQSFFVSSYWRNGPVLNNALSGLDQALWDIKGKRANMPLYQLLGGKSRFAVDSYTHADGKTPEEVAENVTKFMEEGYRYIRIQLGGYGSLQLAKEPDFKNAGFGSPGDQFMDVNAYVRAIPDLFKKVRMRCGEEINLLHDSHERVPPMDMLKMCRRIEEYSPYWIEDPVSPENMDWFKSLRSGTVVPFAMGELFNNNNEFVEAMSNKLFDYIRCHLSQIGGITPAMKVARLGEFFNIRTGWHGPGDVSPVGHAAQAHIDLAIWNFGVQEIVSFDEKTKEIFPGTPEIKNGYIYVNDKPGLGIEINEKLAAKYPVTNNAGKWTLRERNGTIIRP